MIGPESKGMEN